MSHWVYSITTRIKTFICTSLYNYSHWLIEYIPLQQGLRQCIFFFHNLLFCLIEYIPLQQGLRLTTIKVNREYTISHWVYSITTRIKTWAIEAELKVSNHVLIEYIPLQQGLRHENSIRARVTLFLIEYIPLQQGLRQL